jgi:hypothetical protein
MDVQYWEFRGFPGLKMVHLNRQHIREENPIQVSPASGVASITQPLNSRDSTLDDDIQTCINVHRR